jgi:hypothetical protein
VHLRALLIASLLGPSAALGQAGQAGPDALIEEFAQTLSDSLSPRWVGPRVDWPETVPRPTDGMVLTAPTDPVAVQIAPGATGADAEAMRDALAAAHRWLEGRGWPVPPPDGGRGGTAGFDLYVVPSTGFDPRPGKAYWDQFDLPFRPDGAIVFATLRDDVPPDRIEACVTSTYVQAALLAHDPAEAPAWRRATADYVAFLLTGHFGCSDDGVIRQQRHAERAWVDAAPESGEGGALFLAMLSQRTDDLTGNFVRDLWTIVGQRTWDHGRLRAQPDFWEVLRVVMEVGGDPLDRLFEEFGVARYFTGPRRAGARIAVLGALPDAAEVPLHGQTTWDELPRRVEPRGLELAPRGSAYVAVDTRQAPAGSTLRVWLRGEFGVAWSLTAVRLDADGAPRTRVRAPYRLTDPRSYLPVELADGETATVLLVITQMGARPEDADLPTDAVRSFRLILDKVEP